MAPRRFSKNLLGLGYDRREAPSRRSRGQRSRPGLEILEGRQLLSGTSVPGSVWGQGTTLSHQDSFVASTVGAIVGGVVSYSGNLTFSDKAAGDTFTSASITSVQVNEATPIAGPTSINGGFTITGTARLNGGTAASYYFTASGSLPFPANAGSTGGVGIRGQRAERLLLLHPVEALGPGRDGSMEIAQPVQVATTTQLTASANPSVYGQPVYFTAKVTPASARPGDRVGQLLVDSNAPVIEPVVNGVATYATPRSPSGRTRSSRRTSGHSAYAPSQDTIGSLVTNQAIYDDVAVILRSLGGRAAAQPDGDGHRPVAELRLIPPGS